MPILPTACSRDCPDACRILAHVEDGRVVRLQGDPSHPITRGFLCERTSKVHLRQEAPDRIRTPLLRRKSVLEPVTWEEALDVCASQLTRIREQSGAASILHYRSGGSLGLLQGLWDLFFHAFGPVTVKRGSVCEGAGIHAQCLDFGESDASEPQDMLHARTIVLWGKNPAISSPHLLPLLREARSSGSHLVLMDPIRHESAAFCDEYVRVRPGGDLALALGMGRWIVEHERVAEGASSWCEGLEGYRRLVLSKSAQSWATMAGLEPSVVAGLAERICRGPSTIFVGWGMQRRRQGCATVRAIDALGLISGNVGVPGCGVSFYVKRRAAFDQSFLPTERDAPRTVREPCLGQDILDATDPPIRFVWVTAGNPVVMLPDSETTARALRSRDFVVVVDSHLTDTCLQATLVLPCTTMLESDDLVGAYGHPYLGVVRPVVAPVGEARSDFRIMKELAGRVGLSDLLSGDEAAWKQRMLGDVPLAELERGAMRSPVAPRVAFEGRRFPTGSGKAHLLREVEALDLQPDRAFPLRMMAVSTAKSQCSQWSPREPEGPLWARVHPGSASGIADGTIVRLSSKLGSISVCVRHDERVSEGLVVLPKGGSLGRGRCANALLESVLTDAGEGAVLYEQPVWFEGFS